jgi:hypothetical protein
MHDPPLRQDDASGWTGPALRSVAVMVLVMGGMVGLGVGVMAAWGAGHPAYPAAVLAPAQENLATEQRSLQAAQEAALHGDYAQAKAILVQVRESQSAFVEQVLAPAAPLSPELKEVHAALLALYERLGGSLDAALQCVDALATGQAAASPACAQVKATFEQASQEAQEILDRLVALRQELGS